MDNFKKILFSVILFSLTICIKSYAEVVNKVEVKGNQRISLETIVIFGDINTPIDFNFDFRFFGGRGYFFEFSIRNTIFEIRSFFRNHQNL